MIQKLKAWTPIITAVLALLGTLAVAILQTGTASKDDVTAIVSQMNDKTIPYLQTRLDDIADRLARLEGKLDAARGTLGMLMTKETAKIDFPKRQLIPKLKTKE